MNKKIVISIIGLVIILCATIAYMLKGVPSQEFQDLKKESLVIFKIQYGINVAQPSLVPLPMLVDEILTNESTYIKKHELYYLSDFFEIIEDKDFNKNRTIILYPRNFVDLKRTSRFEVNIEFFTTRGVSVNNAKKSVNILKQKTFTQQVCLKKLQRIYIGNEFNKAFFKRAIPKLIDF